MTDLNEAARKLSALDNIEIFTHTNPDGDTLGSAAALCRALRALGKGAYLAPNPQVNEKMLAYVGDYFAPETFRAESFVAVDTAEPHMLCTEVPGEIDLVIDHHPTNKGYGNDWYIDSTAGATGEIITDLIPLLGCPIDSETATLLYIAVTTDTGCFQYSNTTPHTFRTAAVLLEQGADLVRVTNEFFRKVSRQRAALEAMIVNGFEYLLNDRVVFSTITQEMIQRSGVSKSDMDDLSAVSARIAGGDVAVTFQEKENGDTRISIRSTDRLNSAEFASRFGGGGHARAAGMTMQVPVPMAKELVAEALEKIFHPQ